MSIKEFIPTSDSTFSYVNFNNKKYNNALESCKVKHNDFTEYKILVGSTSEHKLNAVYNYFSNSRFIPFTLYYVKTNSLVSEQPFNSETITGVNNRLNSITKYPNYDFYVSIENGIYQHKSGDYDICHVKIMTANKELYIGTSYKVNLFDDNIVDDYQQYINDKSNYNKTFGSYVSKKYNIPADDWYSHYNYPSRKHMVYSAMIDINPSQ